MPIQQMLLNGGGGPVVLPENQMTAQQESYLGDDAYSGFKITSSGYIYRVQDTTENWVIYQPTGFIGWLNSGSASDYSVRVTISGGSTLGGSGEAFISPSHAAGSWWNLASDRTFYYWTTGSLLRGMSGTIELALSIDTASILASTTIDIYLFATPGEP